MRRWSVVVVLTALATLGCGDATTSDADAGTQTAGDLADGDGDHSASDTTEADSGETDTGGVDADDVLAEVVEDATQDTSDTAQQDSETDDDAAPDTPGDTAVMDDGAVEADTDPAADTPVDVGDTGMDAPPPGDTADTHAEDATDADVTPAGCVDEDDDDRGADCAAGPDCDDGDEDVWQSCDSCKDHDGDGYYVGCDAYQQRLGPDCDDTDSTVHPGAPELPADGLINDCAGVADLIPSDGVGIFVSADGLLDGAGTMADPMADLEAALALASQDGRAVFVSKGSYIGPFTTHVSIHGSYDPVTWEQDLAMIGTVVTSTSDTTLSVEADQIALSGLHVAGDASGAHNLTHGILVSADSEAVILANVSVVGGAGVTSHGVRVHGRAVITRSTVDGGTASVDTYGGRVDTGGRLALDHSVIDGGTPTTTSGRSYGVLARGGYARMALNVFHGGHGQSDAYAFQADGSGSGSLMNNILNGGDAAGVASCTVFVGTGGRVWAMHNWIDGGDSPGPTRAVVVWSSSARAVLVNNLIDGGRSDVLASSLYSIAGGEFALYNNNLWGAAQDCLLEQAGSGCMTSLSELQACNWAGCQDIEGVISTPHGLVDPSTGDYHLSLPSELVDAGADASEHWRHGGVEHDIDGDPRPSGAGWDIGVDEVP